MSLICLLRLFEYFTGNVTMWKHFLKDYFIFTRKERLGVISIVSLIIFLILISFAFPFFTRPKSYSHKELDAEIAQLKIEANDSSKSNNFSKNADNEFYDDYTPAPRKKYEPIKGEVFYFDPNTISAAGWQKLGVRDKTIVTIQNYLAKGGRFHKPEDIGKIWGLPAADQQRLMPYVSIKNTIDKNISFEKKEGPKPISHSYPSKTNRLIDVNFADTADYISLPGIGSKLSQRIIAFRNKLGGFYSVTQVGETYLLPDSVFQKIKSRLTISDTTVKHININLASVDEMKSHPYLRYTLANAIFQYRSQHGNFNSVGEIKKIIVITGEVYDKIAPYLSVE